MGDGGYGALTSGVSLSMLLCVPVDYTYDDTQYI
jgi:hypothetical protein